MASDEEVIPRDPNKRIDGSSAADNELYRSAAQRDADRVWYSPEFRRLSGVTQVVPPQESFTFHDRLVHSVKVAQVAATIARKLLQDAKTGKWPELLEKADLRVAEWIDPDYCYVAGLAHDIGHPPYGHAGEKALQDYISTLTSGRDLDAAVREKLVEQSFEGNAQSTRIVAHTSFRKMGEPGLNLTLRSMAAIAKYPWHRGQHPAFVDKLKRKWSFYDSESHVLSQLYEHGFVDRVVSDQPIRGNRRNETFKQIDEVARWPEAEVMDWADDISYAVHDIEDFHRVGRIPLHRIRLALLRSSPDMRHSRGKAAWMTTTFEFASEDREVHSALQYALEKMKKARDAQGIEIAERIPDAFVQLFSSFIVDRMPSSRFDGSRISHLDLQAFGSEAISTLVRNTSLQILEFNGKKRLHVSVAPESQLIAEFFKALCHFYIINSSSVATMQRGQRRTMEMLIGTLVAMSRAWIPQSSPEGRDRTLPARLREYLAGDLDADDVTKLVEALSAGSPDDASDEAKLYAEVDFPIYVAVFDYLCGLKDIQASRLSDRLAGGQNSLSFSQDWLDA